MAYKKTVEELHYIVEGGKKMGEILAILQQETKVGMSAWDIDKRAEELILSVGARPAFKGYRGRKQDPPFPSTICASINQEIVHGIATKEKILYDGDIFSIDIGMQYPAHSGLGKGGNGFFTDTAITFAIGDISAELEQLLHVTKKSLEIGIEQVKIGNNIADIGRAIQAYIQPQGYGIVRDLVGHGVGHEVHEQPRVPNYLDERLEEWKIEEGVVIAIEPMITLGDYNIETDDDGWSIRTRDGSLSAHFEHTIAVTADGPVVVTRRPDEL